jgi:hypothetical protein
MEQDTNSPPPKKCKNMASANKMKATIFLDAKHAIHEVHTFIMFITVTTERMFHTEFIGMSSLLFWIATLCGFVDR